MNDAEPDPRLRAVLYDTHLHVYTHSQLKQTVTQAEIAEAAGHEVTRLRMSERDLQIVRETRELQFIKIHDERYLD